MALTAVPTYFIPDMFWSTLVAFPAMSSATNNINNTNDKMGIVFTVPKSGTLDWFEVRLGTIPDTPDNGLRFSFQDVSLTTGFPDGTQDQFVDVTSGFTANTWLVPPSVMTNDGTSGGVKRTVTQGDLLACVVEFVTFVAGDSVNFSSISGNASYYTGYFYGASAATGSYAKGPTIPVIALKYSDGTYAEFPFPLWPILTVDTTNTFNNTSTPDERALRFQVPFGCTICGFFAHINNDAVLDVVLYDAASSVLRTISQDPDVRSTTSFQPTIVYFPEVTLSANTTYRLAVKPTSGSNVGTRDFALSTNALFGALPGFSQFFLSTRTDAGAWTDTNTSCPWMGIIVNKIDFPSGGSGGSFPFVG
jgi:hypothetical protein